MQLKIKTQSLDIQYLKDKSVPAHAFSNTASDSSSSPEVDIPGNIVYVGYRYYYIIIIIGTCENTWTCR